MNTSVTARHCEISEELRQRTDQVLGRLGALVTRPVDAAVVFDVVPQGAVAEIRIHGSKGESYVASAEAKDHRTALDRAEDRIKRQLEKDASAARRRGVKDSA